MLTVQAVGAALGLLGTPLWSRWLGKKLGAISAYAIALGVGITPITLRLLHLMPPNGTPQLFVAVAAEKFVNAGFATMTGVLLASMIADVVEDVEVRTGRRSEGLLFSADSLFKKTTSAAGPAIAGLIIWIVAFPPDARRTGVSPEVLHNLALVYLPSVMVLYVSAILCLFLFPISKQVHEDNLRRLSEAEAIYDQEQSQQAATSTL
jgi:Na+/melibiose symporter-like transporter